MRSSFTITRRGVLRLAAAGGLESLLRAEDPEFWNKKDPSSWSADEIDRLITKSPWAKQISGSEPGAGRPRGDMGGGGGQGTGARIPGVGGIGGIGGIGMPGTGRGGMGIPGGGGGMGGRRRGGGGGGAAPVRFNGVVRWESAQPILEALKTPLPESFADRYVISVSGMPLHGEAERSSSEDSEDAAARRVRDGALERLKSFTELQKKGAAPLQPGVVEQNPASTGVGVTVLFGFSKELLAISPQDGEITFSTQMGTTAVKVKFDLKRMLYHKALAV